jgi:hypothetical protein
VNLASLKYREVLKEFGGPIERVETRSITIFGVPVFQSNAFLVPGLVRQGAPKEVYGNANGTGESPLSQVARFKAISEALERWAHNTLWHSAEGKNYGFDIDPSSTGMSAYPGLFHRQARRGAVLEAVERLAILSWWEGHCAVSELPPMRDGIRALRVHHSGPKGEVVILYRKAPESGDYSYGQASGRTVAEAQARAVNELARTASVLELRREKGLTSVPKYFFERRCLFFATENGHELFQAKIKAKPTKSEIVWKPVFDGQIPGPWTKYTTVWRVAQPMPSRAFLDPTADDYFFW